MQHGPSCRTTSHPCQVRCARSRSSRTAPAALLGDDAVGERLELRRAGQPGNGGDPPGGQAHHPLDEHRGQAATGVGGRRGGPAERGFPAGDGGRVPVPAGFAGSAAAACRRPGRGPGAGRGAAPPRWRPVRRPSAPCSSRRRGPSARPRRRASARTRTPAACPGAGFPRSRRAAPSASSTRALPTGSQGPGGRPRAGARRQLQGPADPAPPSPSFGAGRPQWSTARTSWSSPLPKARQPQPGS